MILFPFLILIFSIIIHEIAHGFAALKLGDPTAKAQGRLRLNPVSHVDVIGSLLVPGLLLVSGSPVLFGWAKPVPIDPRYFRSPYQGIMLVALAGPLSNIALAVGFALLTKTIHISNDLIFLLVYGIKINLALAAFNLLPIPPLDGSKILQFFLPEKGKELLYRIEPYGFLLVFGLSYLGVLNKPLFWVLNGLYAIFIRGIIQ